MKYSNFIHHIPRDFIKELKHEEQQAEMDYPIDEQLKQKVIAKIPIDILEFLTLATEYVSERKS